MCPLDWAKVCPDIQSNSILSVSEMVFLNEINISFYWPETDRLPDISLAKMGWYGISRELQFRVYNNGEACVGA